VLTFWDIAGVTRTPTEIISISFQLHHLFGSTLHSTCIVFRLACLAFNTFPSSLSTYTLVVATESAGCKRLSFLSQCMMADVMHGSVLSVVNCLLRITVTCIS
jgi:hypothetical protein